MFRRSEYARITRTSYFFASTFLISLVLSACGGGGGGSDSSRPSPTYAVGGAITGLSGTVVLQNNNGDNLSQTENGNFSFATNIASGNPYSVTVLSQPLGQTCTANAATGSVSGTVSNVVVSCINNMYAVGGTISGLSGSIVLQNNLGANLVVTTDGSFTFNERIANNGQYAVSVLTHPTGQTCTVSTGSGTVSAGNVNNIAVTCSTNSYQVGGAISGLVGTVILQVNGTQNLPLTTNGAFNFPAPLAHGSPYSVTVLTQPATQTCSIANGTGAVASGNVSNIVVACTTNTHAVGGAVTGLRGSIVLQNNFGNDTTISTNGSFSFSTAITDGATYSVTIKTPPVSVQQHCSLSNANGTIVGANISNVAITCSTQSFAYAANSSSNNVTAFSVDESSGSLTSIGSTAAGTYPVLVSVHPTGKFAYASNYASNNISTFTIDSGTGMLTSGPSVPTGYGPIGFSIHPSGAFAYVVTRNTNEISAFTVDATTGTLNGVGPSVGTGAAPVGVVLDPTGKFVYVTNSLSNELAIYSVDSLTGELSSLGREPTGSEPRGLAIDPTGRFIYVTNSSSNTVSAFSINAATGALISVGAATAAGTRPNAIAVDPTGRFAYVSNESSATIWIYAIDDTTGVLTAIGTPVSTGAAPYSIAIDPLGQFLYVANASSNSVFSYTIDSLTGALTSMGTPTFTGSGPMSITTTH